MAWQFLYSNYALADYTANPATPETQEDGSLADLISAIDNGAPIRVGMLKWGHIHKNTFSVENIRYSDNGPSGSNIVIASLVIRSSNLSYDSANGLYNGVDVDIYHTPAVAIITSDGHERFFRPNGTVWVSAQPRVFRWYGDV